MPCVGLDAVCGSRGVAAHMPHWAPPKALRLNHSWRQLCRPNRRIRTASRGPGRLQQLQVVEPFFCSGEFARAPGETKGKDILDAGRLTDGESLPYDGTPRASPAHALC